MTLRELVAKYVATLAESGTHPAPVLATDLSLYLGTLRPWFDDAMVFWANYIAEQVMAGPLSPPRRRRVIRYIPLPEPRYLCIAEAQEHWLRTKAAMHWLLSPGPYNLVTFGQLAAADIQQLNYCVIPRLVLVESPGIYSGNFETRVQRGSRGKVSNATDFVAQFLSTEDLTNTDPATQLVFPLYYNENNFRARELSRHHFRDILGRFLWKLQAGICPLCGPDIRYGFDDMEVDHVLARSRGGNNTLLNLEMKCRDHNNPKNRRLSETQDYIAVLRHAVGVWPEQPAVAHFLRSLFGLADAHIDFPVRFAFGLA